MGKVLKKILSVSLVLLMVFTSIPLCDFDIAVKAEATEYKVGDIIQFGSYPQSEVKDEALIAELNALAPEWDEWTSYGYYSGNGSYGSMVPGDWMRYTDITYNGNKYRGVKFTQYRPSSIHSGSTSYTAQEENGYCTDIIYWFKFESINWRVLDPATGMVMSETILDAQPYSNTMYYNTNEVYKYAFFNDTSYEHYANDYETSSIRQWLNENFYNTAFTDVEKKEINITTLKNDTATIYDDFNSNSTNDKIFLLSYNEVKDSNYGFNSDAKSMDKARKAKGSNYAKCQGLDVYDGNYSSYWLHGYSDWILRDAGESSAECANVHHQGISSSDCGQSDSGISLFNYGFIYKTSSGIRPAMRLKFNTEEQKNIAILTTNKSFCIEPKDSMWVAFGIMREDGLLEEKWEKMALTVSDPTIVSLSDYEETEYGYSLEIKGKKEGSTNIVVTDTESGSSEVFEVTVCDDFSKSSSFSMEAPYAFYPSNKYESDILTNIYDMNGLYVNNYKCVKTFEGYNVTFDVYNQRHHIGAVDVFDKYDNWIESYEIEKYSDITSLYDTGEQIYYMVFGGNWLSYQHAMHSKKTSFGTENPIKVPEGGYFTVSNNYAESIGTFFFNSAEIFYEGMSAAIDVFTGNIDSEPFVDLIFGKFDETPALKKAFQDIFTSSLDKEIRDISQNILKKNAEDAYVAIADLFKNILESCKIEWVHLMQIASGVGEGVFEKFAGPAGLALKACFSITGYTNKLLNARHIATSTNKPYASFYSDTEKGFVNPYGIFVTDNGNIDAEAVLQVFRISNDDSISVLLDSADPLAIHELYNICFVKNDKLVQPNGKVKVHIPIPENMKGDTCTVYRQETDGSWTILQARKENGYLVFETDHFSLYAIVGIGKSIKINSLPNKLVYEPNEMLDTSGLTVDVDGNIVESGFICEPCIMSGLSKQTIKVNYLGLVTEFDISVTPHKHTVNDDGICEKCGVDVTDGCSCRCHSDNFFEKLIWKITIFFQKIFKKNQECSCGVAHY